MKVCKKCNKSFGDELSFCDVCGSALTEESQGAAPQYRPQNVSNLEPVSVGEWVGIMLLPLIPCVGGLVWLILMFVWAFDDNAKASKRTYARASLIIALIGVFIGIIALASFASAGMTLGNILRSRI